MSLMVSKCYVPFPLFSLYPALSFLCVAFPPVSIVTTSIVSLTVKRNLADVSGDATPSGSYFDAQSPYLLSSLLPPAASGSQHL